MRIKTDIIDKRFFDSIMKKYSGYQEFEDYICNKAIWDTDECGDMFDANAHSTIEHLIERILVLEFGEEHGDTYEVEVVKCANAIYDAVIEVEKEEYAEQALLSTDPYKYYGLKRSDF